MSFSVLVEENRLSHYSRPRVWRKEKLQTVQDAQAYIQSLILEGYKIKFASIVQDVVKKM